MAVRFPNGTTDALKRTTNVVPASSDYSCIFWVKSIGPIGSSPRYRCHFLLVDSIASYSDYAAMFSQPGVDNAYIDVYNGSDAPTATATLIPDKWYPVGYVRSGTTHRFYGNGVLTGSSTLDVSASTYGEEWLGNDLSYDFVSEIVGFREWDTALTLAELITEWNSPTAVKTANLWADTPLVSDGNDISGNGYNWTTVGSTIFVDGPIQVPLTNTAATSAYDLGTLPTEIVQVVKDSAGTVQEAWFKFTALVDGVAGWFGFGDLTTYKPVNSPFTGPASSPVSVLGIGGQNVPIQFPVVLGTEYFIRADNVSAPSASLYGLAQLFVATPITTGDIIVPDDTFGFPAAILSSVDGTIKTYIQPFAAGEAGDILHNGVGTGYVLQEESNVEYKFYLPGLEQSSSPATFPFVTTGLGRIRTNQTTNKFWVANSGGGGNPAKITSVDQLGNQGAIYTLPTAGVTGLASSNDESVVYLSGQSSSTNSNVKVWDTGSSTFLSDLAAVVANHIVVDILVLQDDSIVVSYFKSSVTRDLTIKRYNSSGTVLNTYSSFGSTMSSTLPRMAYALDNPNSFWVWIHSTSDGFDTFTNVKASDGSTIITFDVPVFEGGVNQQDETPTPTAYFGISFSCPFYVIPEADIEDGSINVIKVIVPPSPQLFDFTAGGGLSPTTFTLGHLDEQLYDPVASGSGYSIVETPVANYTTTYEVSNDSPNTNITVGPGEDVTVTVTNEFTGVTPVAGSGMYKLVPGKREDTLWVDGGSGETVEVKIPDPNWKTGLFGE